MKPGDLCRVGGGGFVRDLEEKHGYRVTTASGIAIYLGEEKLTPEFETHSGKYYVFYEFHTGNRRTPFVWYWFDGSDIDSEYAYDGAIKALQDFKKRKEREGSCV